MRLFGWKKKILLVEAFETFLQIDSSQKTEKSQKSDARLLRMALRFFHERGKKYVSEIVLEDLERFQIWLAQEKAWAQPSIELNCRTLKKFFRKMYNTEQIPKNPAALWKVPRGASKRRRPMTMEEFAKIYAVAPEWFQRVLKMMRLTGARGKSISEINWEHVDFAKETLLLISRKGGAGQEKVIPLPLYPALREFLESLPRGSDTDPVFKSVRGERLTAQDIATEGSRLIRKVVGLRGVVLYGLRHAIAVEMTEAGIPLEITRQGMGHSSIAQTSHYAKGIASKALAEAFSQIRGKV